MKDSYYVDLIERIRNDDNEAFKELYNCFFTPVYRYMSLYIKEKHLVEEGALDIFLNVWLNRKKLNIRLTVKAYLFGAAHNKCINIARSKRVFVNLESLNNVPDIQYDWMAEDDLQRLISEAVMSLPSGCKEIFGLSRQNKMSNAQIASLKNISVRTVETQISKALKHIREKLGKGYNYLW